MRLSAKRPRQWFSVFTLAAAFFAAFSAAAFSLSSWASLAALMSAAAPSTCEKGQLGTVQFPNLVLQNRRGATGVSRGAGTRAERSRGCYLMLGRHWKARRFGNSHGVRIRGGFPSVVHRQWRPPKWTHQSLCASSGPP